MKTILACLAVLLWCSLPGANPIQIIAIPYNHYPCTQLRDSVQQLTNLGFEIYYYNEEYVIASGIPSSVSGARVIADTGSGELYLVSKAGNPPGSDLTGMGTVLLDMGNTYLLQSRFAVSDIQARTKARITHLKLEPLLFNQAESARLLIRETRTDIQQLISYANPDTIQSYIQALENFQTRFARASNRLAVAEWIRDQFLRLGISNAHLHTYQEGAYSQYNVVAVIPGTIFPDQYILIGGHHDSITYLDPFDYAPGADDNASGAAATLEIARMMVSSGYQPRCSIRFVTFSAEEIGHFGSLEDARYALENDLDLRLVINLDMIANCDPGNTNFKILPYDGSQQHAANAAMISMLYTDLDPVIWDINETGSDSYSYWLSGFNIVFLNEFNFSPWWHTVYDWTSNTDPVYCAEMIRAVTAIAAVYADLPLSPENLSLADCGTGNTMQASWTAPPDPGIQYYKVNAGPSENELGYVQTVSNTHYTVPGLPDEQLSWVGVSSVSTNGTESFLTLCTGTPHLIPQVPTGLTDTPIINGIVLDWLPNSELDLAGYQIYRSLAADEVGDPISFVPESVFTYTDQNLPGLPAYYYYRVCAVDSSGICSPYSAAIASRPVTLNQGILIIDETANSGGNHPFQPTDEMVDEFYDSTLSGLNVTAHLDLSTNQAPLRLADLGVFSSVLWHGNDNVDLCYPALSSAVLRQYISMGGNVFFSLYFPTKALDLVESYPALMNPGSFSHDVLGINCADYSSAARFRYAQPALAGFPPLEVDTLKTVPFLAGHIFKVESIEPVTATECAYTFGSDYEDTSPQGYLNGKAIGVLHQYGLGKAFSISFPLYNMYPENARLMVSHVFSDFFLEPALGNDSTAPGISELDISPNYPNPFTAYTSFRISSGKPQKPLSISIYNLRGQLVKNISSGTANPINYSYSWDGCDDRGRGLAAGVYFIKAQQDRDIVTRKILLMK